MELELERVTKENFNELYALMENDFPEAERRTKADQESLLKNKHAYVNFIKVDGKIAGYFVFWDFGDFLFVEHLATKKEFRGQGLGSIFLKNFISQTNKNILLEVELPTDEISTKRIKFYERLGFVLNDHDYTQPSYHGGGDELPMKVMTLKDKLSKADYERIIRKIKSSVYDTCESNMQFEGNSK